ncbi:hypothetical protein [Spirosoma sp. KCTC 42546]|uniref:hypothetical protein n=1 Tax=Spirosoma sp. KCTC 42546 TaxID=2520506 RepID=UPI00143D8C67|nr:hypothetical protein [Spirosoma sp. KCTC 42546]
MKSQLDSTKAAIKELKTNSAKQHATSSAYREKLDKRLDGVDSRLTDQSLRLHS